MARTSATFSSVHFDQRRSLVLIALGLITAGLFVAAGAVARLYQREEARLAQFWFTRGQQALSEGRAEAAIGEFRDALAYSHSDQYRLRLAQALIAAGRSEEARAHLLTLLDSEPGNGTVNLELARIAAQRGAVGRAAQYYHNALYGVWQDNPEQARRNLRFESAEFFLQHGDATAAESDLIPLAANLPRDAAQHARVAELFLRAGDAERALAAYRTALSINPNYLLALRGAGAIDFRQGEYRDAHHYLELALRGDPTDQQSRDLLQIADLVLKLNPFEMRLPAVERARRAASAFSIAQARLTACATRSNIDLHDVAGTSELQKVYSDGRKLGTINEHVLQPDTDRIVVVMDWVTAAEDAASGLCGPASGADLAVMLAAKQARR